MGLFQRFAVRLRGLAVGKEVDVVYEAAYLELEFRFSVYFNKWYVKEE